MSETLKDKITHGIENKTQRRALGGAMRRGREGRAVALQKMQDPEQFRRHVRSIKEESIDHLDGLIKQFISNATRRGAKVFLAKDGRAAVNYITEIARANGAKTIAKSKSLTTEEIEMNHPLEQMGYKIIETDLGERIIQLAGEKPIHLVFPASHKTIQQVAEIFSKEAGAPIPAEHSALMSYIRNSLREVFLQADIGVTGANVAIAETGTVIIETNEGNGRLVSAIPRVQIVVMGMEKVVPNIEAALEMVQAHPLNATGQKLTTYVSFFSGRCPLSGEDRARELHIVILDNNRRAMRADSDFREALYCIRCGACMNICPTYEVVGGHVFGHIYPGPIGIPWTAGVHGLNKTEFASLCVACGLCHEMCPIDIDIPYMIAKVKEQNKDRNGQIFANRVMMKYDDLAKVASLSAPLSNWILRRTVVRYLMEITLGIDKNRLLPTFSRHTFHRWWERHLSSVKSTDHKVAYFVDVYADCIRPDIGIAAVTLLEKAGAQVVVPIQKASGMPYFSYGELQKARKIAEFNVATMVPLVREGYEIVATEPTAAYCFKELYPKLLKSDDSQLVADHTQELLEYLSNFDQLRSAIKNVFSGVAGFHISCHQRTLREAAATLDLLRSTGLDLKVIETGTCCGMGGTFGLKAGVLGSQLSKEVGEPLFELFTNGQVEFGLTQSSVCTMQLEQGTNLRFEHPIAILAAAVEGRFSYLDHLRKH
jgi:L-lactate dehydrogenase complex protein LldF